MKEQKQRKPVIALRLPLIKERTGLNVSNAIVSRSLKLERINRQKNMALIDISKINKIEREFKQMTRNNEENLIKVVETVKEKEPRDEMRESKLLLLKNIAPLGKKENANLLSSLVAYNNQPNKLKSVNIPTANISISPTKIKKMTKKISLEKEIKAYYHNPEYLLKIDFVKMFIVEELLYYITKTGERLRDEMSGFCKFYNENTDEETYFSVAQVLNNSEDYLTAIFYEKVGFYVYLILGADTEVQEEAQYLLSSLGEYMHTNNLIILDLLMDIIDREKYTTASQFHVHNTARFNENRRKIKHDDDRMHLLHKNNDSLKDLIRSVVLSCEFESLKVFIEEIISKENFTLMDKIREVALMLISLDGILSSSIENVTAIPKPPFLPVREKPVKYTLVLDMDETLIHTQILQTGRSSLLIRPFCQEFLTEMSQYYELVIFTAAVKEYADKILNSIDPVNRISHRLYREHTRIEEFVSIKDLSLINRDLAETIIIDNIASNFKLQPRNGIEITTWTGDPEDTSLLNLIPVMKKLAIDEVKDVRNGLEKLSEFMEMKMMKGEEIVFDEISLKNV